MPLCLEQRVGVINFYALASGFLTGKYRKPADAGKSQRGDTAVQNYLNERGQRILAALDTVAVRTRSRPGQVAIAWLLAKPAVTAPIASATSLAQVAELEAATRVKVSAEDIALLDQASAQ